MRSLKNHMFMVCHGLFFSEVMFFAAFFGALFYVRTFAVPWLAGLGEKGVGVEAIGLWEGFEATWPLITTPDAGSAYNLAEKKYGFSWVGPCPVVAANVEHYCLA